MWGNVFVIVIADARPQLIVSFEFRSPPHIATILLVQDQTIDSHHDRLLHLVGRYDPDFLHAIATCTSPGYNLSLGIFRREALCRRRSVE